MTFIKALTTLVLSTMVVASLLLLGARLPGGERLGAALAQWSLTWTSDPFESSRQRETALLRYPGTEPLYNYLVMSQIASNARRVRLAALRDPFLVGWQVSLPRTEYKPTAGAPVADLGKATYTTGYQASGEAKAESGHLMIALLLLILAFGQVIFRRR